MAPGQSLADSVGSITEGARGLFRRATNSITGRDFNRRAFEEAKKAATTYVDDEDDLESDDEEYAELQYSGLLNEKDEFAVKETPGRLQQLTYKLSETGLAAACQAAGVSAEYAGYATKLVATEVARNAGWLANCKTTTETMLAIKKRFPVLEDIKRAYDSGKGNGKEQTRRASITYRTHPPAPAITHPRVIKQSSNLNDKAVISDSQIRTKVALHKGKRIYDPSVHAGLEEVPADPDDLYADDEDAVKQGVIDSTNNLVKSAKRDQKSSTAKNEIIDEDGMEEVPIDDSDEDDGMPLSPGAKAHLGGFEEGDDYFANMPTLGNFKLE